MYVSIHATTHPVEGAGFLNLECDAFAVEQRGLAERQRRWIDHGRDLTIELIDLPQGEPSDEQCARAEIPEHVVDISAAVLRFRCA